jgi:hypothetical protein
MDIYLGITFFVPIQTLLEIYSHFFTWLLWSVRPVSPYRDMHLIIPHDNHTTSFPINFEIITKLIILAAV